MTRERELLDTLFRSLLLTSVIVMFALLIALFAMREREGKGRAGGGEGGRMGLSRTERGLKK